MSFDDDMERRLREALTRPRSTDRVDADAFLERVHRGARVRRVKRGVSVAAAAALVVVGGAAATSAGGFLDSPQTPAASRTDGSRTPGPHESQQAGKTTGRVAPPRTSRSKTLPASPPVKGPVTVTPAGPIAKTEVTPVSLTATGTMHQWVLAKTPGRDCGAPACATVFSTSDHGGSWSDVGQLPAPPATSDAPTSRSVSSLRFTKRDDGSGIYDGWAYGDALWSTHDSGNTWSAADAPPGKVTTLEAWGGYAYAGVSSSTLGDDTAKLYRSPTTTDAWKPVDIGAPLTSVQALAAAKGAVGLIDSGGLHSVLYVSADGTSWQRASACPAGTDPSSLSTASDSVSGVSALWVACTSPTSTVLRYTDTTALGVWHDVQAGSLGAAVVVAAENPTTAYVAGATVPGIARVSASSAPVVVHSATIGVPVYFGFTNSTYGYLLSSDGTILSTTEGGKAWVPYAVGDTLP